MEELKNNLIYVFYHLGYIEFTLFLIIFLLFLLLFMLSLLAYPKKIIFPLLFILSFVVLFSTPFLIQTAMTKGFYKIQISYNKISPLHYADAFLIDMDITNIGKRNISKCLVKINVYNKSKNKLQRLKNLAQPRAIFKRMIFKHIRINQTKNIVLMIDKYPYRNYPYETSVDCQ
ncbi:hypothetical protein BKH42_07800 [Helicobacter sp. 13S00482-2]|uniref:DUF2393 family protein n=1 Tax=Helicobacter sp. 13S00482-2 TaxID=1476200 RepID=UPI000BA52AEC|nr:DUF2393 family protein [Helicobacter sp. 13S00482-2]PAF53077.1 hypothetical protein BKH42_07800 [Helicobacter sp. 13S00482-2]